METLELKETEYTPYISLDAESRKIVIRGNSFPENTFDFYKDVMDWLEEFFNSKPVEIVEIEMEINYFNSSSSQLFFQLFDLLDDAYGDGVPIKIHWVYEEDNSSAEEAGEDFVEEYATLPIEMIVKEA
jgi:hypothetical protein